jgi:hypothetical protein
MRTAACIVASEQFAKTAIAIREVVGEAVVRRPRHEVAVLREAAAEWRVALKRRDDRT